MEGDAELLRWNVIGQRLLRIGSLLLGSPLRSMVATTRASHADGVDDAVLASWVAEEGEKRGVVLSQDTIDRIVGIARKKPARRGGHRLAVACCYFNPAGWKRLRQNYLRFLHAMEWHGVPVFNAEVAYQGQDFPTRTAYIQIRGNERQAVWQKERLINLIAESIPACYTHVAWIDADVIFLENDWPSRAMSALSQYPVVQLWSHWHCAGPVGEVSQVLASVGDMGFRYAEGAQCSPGGAWAAKRSVFPLYDKHIVGSGDAMTLEGWLGKPQSRCLKRTNDAMKADYLAWADDAYRKVGGKIGCLPGDAVHLFHGSRADRQYVERWSPLIQGGYDPALHLQIAENGLLEWTDCAPPRLAEHVRNYFFLRREDG